MFLLNTYTVDMLTYGKVRLMWPSSSRTQRPGLTAPPLHPTHAPCAGVTSSALSGPALHRRYEEGGDTTRSGPRSPAYHSTLTPFTPHTALIPHSAVLSSLVSLQYLGVDLPRTERLKVVIWHALLESYIESRGFAGWTHLHPTFFMEVLSHPTTTSHDFIPSMASSSV